VDKNLFYATAATVIPLLLISTMATRSLRPGELQQQPRTTALGFGLPIVGEIAAFAFLFFEPVPPAVAATLAVVTWAGLISQLALAAWWVAVLIGPHAPKVPIGHDDSPAVIDTTIKPPGLRPLRHPCAQCGGRGWIQGERGGKITCMLCSGAGYR
jgi:hypothetical protein